ncbi:hypothetical protein BG000_008694 [Podila horticola]|nr:hypothetical protein BG000_008694 [Podila horticola]
MTTPETAPDALNPILHEPKAKLQPRLTPEELEYRKKPKVLIVGAGIGGITLAILLQKAGYPYAVFERAKEVKPLGSAISMGGNCANLLKQLGVYDEFRKMGKPWIAVDAYTEDLQLDIVMNYKEREAICGSEEFIVPRPELYDLLLRQVPQENIYMGKKVLSFLQSENGVLIRCSDNSSYEGDILVGADGAYSAVRQHMYAELKKEGNLPKSDDLPLPFSCVCLVGQTQVLDPEEFPQLKLEHSQFSTVNGSTTMYSNSSKENDSFRNSEWGPEAAEAMCKQVRHFKVPGGKDGKVLTLGDYFDRTPKGLISKVMLEEKVFTTWYNVRSVLLGDACHKLNPAGAAGALSAMHDAVCLANWINTLQTKKLPDLRRVFKEYYTERYPIAKDTFERSQMLSKIPGKSFQSKCARAMMRNMPAWLMRRLLVQLARSRPQVSFLPQVEDKGTIKPLYQRSLHKTLAILEQRKKVTVAV